MIEVIPGGPSEKAGLLQGDRILKVDDKVIAGVGFPQDSMVRRMKGPAGSKVKITVGRGKETIPFDITRGKVPVHCVDAAFMANDTTGYIKLSKFSKTTFNEVSAASVKLLAQGMKKLILDLRDNTGGYFDQALLLSDMFLERGDEIVYMQGLHRKKENYRADGKGILKDISPEGHARLLKRHTDNVILTYDSDAAGTKAAMRAIPILREAGFNIRVLDLKPYKDPDELIVHEGAAGYEERIRNAVNFFLFQSDVAATRQPTCWTR